VHALASAPLDDVLAAWSGLGYYSRARNLHRCAQAVVAEHGGVFPGSAAGLETLPGIGRSTAAAIAAFCFGERAAILDGNVKRVLTRALGFDGDLALASEEKRLWDQAQALLPAQDVDVYTQGLMDLGATVCLTRRPSCLLCPLRAGCVAFSQGDVERYPIKTRRLKRGRRENAWLLLRQAERLHLVQRPDTGVWAGLWSLSEFESVSALQQLSQRWPGDGEWRRPLLHKLTHFDWTLHTLNWTLPPYAKLPDGVAARGRWFKLDEARSLGLPAPVRQLLEA
jgi:A/G-specific adenine glycosylase